MASVLRRPPSQTIDVVLWDILHYCILSIYITFLVQVSQEFRLNWRKVTFMSPKRNEVAIDDAKYTPISTYYPCHSPSSKHTEGVKHY